MLKEREANYTKYMDKIKQLIPEGWTTGDLIEARLKNSQGQAGDYLLLLASRAAGKETGALSVGRIIVIQKLDTNFVKKWESADDIAAVDGIFGDTEEFRYPVDINKDDLDEIVVTFAASKIPTQGLVHLWIYAWDGTQGNLISPKGAGTLKGLSEFTGSQLQPPAIIDYDGDGIYEVFAQGEKIYKWDSAKKTYVYWKDRQIVE